MLNLLKRTAVLIIASAIMITSVPVLPGTGKVYADNPNDIAWIYLDGHTRPDMALTDSIYTLNSYIKKNKSHKIRIVMRSDWNAAAKGRKDDFDKTLLIPSGSNVTLDMCGHIFNRDNAASNNSGFNGEVIQV